MKIKLGYSPHAGDAMIFCGLATGAVDTGDYQLDIVVDNIQTLNDRATRGELEVTTLSVHAYAYVRRHYAICRCGACFAQDYGPRVVSSDPMDEKQLADSSIAIAGTTTSACLALQLYRPGLRTRMLPWDKIMPAVQTGLVDCGLVIYEDQLAQQTIPFHVVIDLAQWWKTKTSLPLPLTVTALRKDLPAEVQADISKLICQSARYAAQHPSEALSFMTSAASMAPGGPQDLKGIYVSDLAWDMGESGKKAIEAFLQLGEDSGLTPPSLPLEFA